jgi:hypothetical protein
MSLWYPYMAAILPYINIFADTQKKQKEDKERIRKEWRKSMNYPRKKKKAVRKRLKVDWAIACWEIPNYTF